MEARVRELWACGIPDTLSHGDLHLDNVAYDGTVPDPFRGGREIILTGSVENGTFVGERDTLITKCPSKFADEARENPDQVIIE